MLAFISQLQYNAAVYWYMPSPSPTSSHYSACISIFTLSLIYSLLFLHIALAIPLNVITYRPVLEF